MMCDTHEQGICPKCGSGGLSYGDTKKQDIAIGYEYTCEGCGFTGIEWYNLHFTEHTDPDCLVVLEAIKKTRIIIIMQKGCIQTVKATASNIEVLIAIEPDEFINDDGPTEYNRLIALADTDEYKQIY